MMELMQRGGPVMWVQLGLALGVATIFLERLFHLHRAHIRVDDFLQGVFNILRKGNIVEAATICEETPGPVARVVQAAVLKAEGEPSEICQAVEDAGLEEMPRLQARLGLLATLGQIAPYMGLLGTVLGMIEVLLRLQERAPLVHAGDLAGGLWEALISTAAGLSIAAVAYAAYNLLVGRVEAILLDMERAATEAVSFLQQLKRRPGTAR